MNDFSLTIEATPNPATTIFRSNQQLVDAAHDFTTAQEAEISPLASKIFGFPWTSGVHLGTDFIAVTKQDWVEWDFLAQPLGDLIVEHLRQGLPLLLEGRADAGNENAILETDSEIVKGIKRALDNEIRPAVAYDGGDVIFASYDDNKLVLQFKGSCVGCPSKSVTLKEGIEVRMKELFPEIQEVIGL